MNKYLILFTFLAFGKLEAQTIITDRPDQTESSSTIEKGSLQIESGVLVGFTQVGNQQILAPTNLFRVGITNGIELRVLNQFETLKNNNLDVKESGLSDLEIGTKIQLFQKESVNTEIAFLSHIILPTGSEGLSIDDVGTINKLSIAHEINKTVGIGYNVGYNYFGSGSGDFTYSMALGFDINDKASIYIEPYGDIIEFEELNANIDAGVTYLLNENFQLDFSFGTGLSENMNYISAGVSWQIR